MKDMIYRQDALKAIEFTWAGKAAFDAIKELPSAQPEIIACGEGELNAQPEQRTGKWISFDDEPNLWRCSECGNVIYSCSQTDRNEHHAFCGRCGADMRGDAE